MPMLSFSNRQRYCLYRGVTDMLKRFNGLSGLARDHISHELLGGADSKSRKLPWTDLQLLLEGIEIKSVIRRPLEVAAKQIEYHQTA